MCRWKQTLSKKLKSTVTRTTPRHISLSSRLGPKKSDRHRDFRLNSDRPPALQQYRGSTSKTIWPDIIYPPFPSEMPEGFAYTTIGLQNHLYRIKPRPAHQHPPCTPEPAQHKLATLGYHLQQVPPQTSSSTGPFGKPASSERESSPEWEDLPTTNTKARRQRAARKDKKAATRKERLHKILEATRDVEELEDPHIALDFPATP